MKYSIYGEARSILTIIARALLGFVVGAILYFIFLAVWWLAYPYKTADIVEPMKVLNTDHIVEKSELLRLRLEIDKQSDITPQVSRNIVCTDTVYLVPNTLTSGGAARPKGKYTAEVQFGIPQNIPDGVSCYFQFTNSYRVNPLKVVDKVWKSEVFKVIEKE